MVLFEDPAADASEARDALRGLAYATRRIDDPSQIQSVLGSLTSAVASMSQALHQVASFHDGAATAGVWVAGESRAGRAAAYQVSWELHRAGEILRQVSDAIGRAQNAESPLIYDRREIAPFPEAPRRSPEHGLGL